MKRRLPNFGLPITAAGLLFPCMLMFGMPATLSAATTVNAQEVEKTNERESLFPEGSRSLAGSHFTWGAEAGASIDLTGHDMSTFDADVLIGYKNDFIRLVGIGAGVHRAFGNGNNFIPLYGVFRSSFRKKPSLLFAHVDFGYSFNTIGDSPTFGDFTGSIGCGINLAMSRRFHSHILIALGFKHFNELHRSDTNIDVKDIYFARITFGVNF
ncbi:MAG: hypothetical protein HDS82_03195 [Bacteroidales bacterium]|nr:hypothetical protein [Bacteroidales bacterium]